MRYRAPKPFHDLRCTVCAPAVDDDNLKPWPALTDDGSKRLPDELRLVQRRDDDGNERGQFGETSSVIAQQDNIVTLPRSRT